MQFVVETRSAAETQRFGRRLGALLAAGDVLALDGPLGAGKTTLVQGLALGLGVPKSARVNSPTFSLCNEHAGRVPLYHLDLYRLGDEDELDTIGLPEYLGGRGVAVVEWFARFPRHIPQDALVVTIERTSALGRRLTLQTESAALAARLAGLTTRSATSNRG